MAVLWYNRSGLVFEKGGRAEIFSFPSWKDERVQWRREVLGGVLTALALLATFAVVPALWARAGAPFVGAYAATLLAACLATLAAGLFARQPIVVAPALGINVWLVYGVIYPLGVAWQEALAACVIAALLVLLTVTTPLRRIFLASMPRAITEAARGGVGLLVVFTGLQTGKLVVGSPLTVTMLGSLSEPAAFVALAGLAASLAFWAMGVRAAAFWGVLSAVLLALFEGFLVLPEAPFLLPEGLDRTAFALDFAHLAELSGVVLALWLFLFFDTRGTFAALGEAGEAHGLAEKRTLLVLAAGNVVASLLGAGAVALAKESAAARAVGARTPLAACAAAAVLLLALFLEPVAAAVLDFSAVLAPLLIFSGCLLLKGLRLDWRQTSEHVAVFAVLLVTPLSCNLAAGLGAGMIVYVFLEVFSGRGKKIHPALFFFAGAFSLYFAYYTP